MAALDELSLTVRLFLKSYPWRRIDPVPWTPLRKPLAGSRLALRLLEDPGLKPPVLVDYEPA